MRGTRQLHTGDFVIRYNSTDDHWECWLVGASAPYDSIIGTGKFPVRAMAAWNVLANEAKRNYERPAPSEKQVKKSKSWWRL